MFCSASLRLSFFFFFNDPAPTEIYTLSLHDALPIPYLGAAFLGPTHEPFAVGGDPRSAEHTSELQSPVQLVCRLLLEKKKRKNNPRLARVLPDRLINSQVAKQAD